MDEIRRSDGLPYIELRPHCFIEPVFDNQTLSENVSVPEMSEETKSMKPTGLTVKIDKRNQASIVGQPCDFYVYLLVDGKSFWSNWIKGSRATTLWFTFRNLSRVKKKQQFFDKAKSLYNELGHITYET